MTEHILNFAIGIDDASIIKNVQERAGKEIINEIKADCLNKLFTTDSWASKPAKYDQYKDKVVLNDHVSMSDFSKEIVKAVMEEYKDEIIEKASEMLCESYKRTKAWKEKTEQIGGGE